MATGLNRGKTIGRLLSRGIAVAAILTLVGVVASGSGSAKSSAEATVTRSSAAPHQLLGKWRRNVTAAVKVGGIAKKRGVWSIVIGKGGGRTENSIEIYAPGDNPKFPATGSGITVTGNRLSFTPNSGFEYAFCFSKGIYRWKVSGRSLAFTKVSDKCPARTAVLAGVWKRS
jgi:hypothetical protein